jgi:hypothetical protein
MTTIGKILVFLILVAALGLGGLMVFVSKTTPNWADAVTERDDKIKVFKNMLEQDAETRKKLIRENEKMKDLLDGKIIEAHSVKVKLEQDLKKLGEQAATAAEQQEVAQRNAVKSAEEAKRLETEIGFVQNVVQDREKMIVKLNDDLAQARTAEQAAKNDAVTAGARLQSLYDQLKEKDIQLAKYAKNGQSGGGTGAGPRDATYTNPPPVYVKGSIDQVDDADRSLVKITIGSDSGIRKDQTLEVYRTSPKAEYLGRLVIVDADLHHAIGRVLRQPGMPVAALRPGDQVASTLRQ